MQDAWIERLRGNESEIEKSLRQLSRLLLDKIVEGLPRADWHACRHKLPRTQLKVKAHHPSSGVMQTHVSGACQDIYMEGI